MTDSVSQAVNLAMVAKEKGEALSIALLGNAAELLPRLAVSDFKPDIVTDQTAAHDPLNGYIPSGLTMSEAATLRQLDKSKYLSLAKRAIKTHVEAMLLSKSVVLLFLIMVIIFVK